MPDKKKLVYYGIKYLPSRGGTSRVAENLVNLLRKDYQIKFYCYRHPKAEDHFPDIEVFQFKEWPFGGFGVFIYYFLSAIHMLLIVSKEHIVHAHKTDCAFFIPLLRLKFKVILTSHEAPYHRDKWSIIGKSYFKIMERIYIYCGAKLTSISKPLTDYYTSRYNKDVRFIPNGVQPEVEVDVPNAEKVLEEHGIKGEFLLFAARRIMATKGLHTMLEGLHQFNYDKPILIAGDLHHAEDYINNLKGKYPKLKTKYIGFVDGLPLLMGLIRKSKYFIFPSEIEGMSMMLLEVVCAGTPVICSDIPENTQVFDNSEVLYFESKNAKDLHEKLRYAFKHPEEMDAKCSLALHKIKRNYTWTSIVEEYKKLYQQM